MDGKIILIVGGRGSGKTTTLRSFLTKVHSDALLLHDVSGQHKDYYKKSILPFKEFCEICTKVERCVIAFEEATIFIRSNTDATIQDFCVTSRYRENTIFFVFHSLRKVPWYIYDLCNTIVLLKTNDPIDIVERFGDPDLVATFMELQKQPQLLNKETGKYYSPKVVYQVG